MRPKRDVLLILALFLGLFSYCLVLLVSREAPLSLLTVTGIGALVLVLLSTWAYWHSLLERPEPMAPLLCALCKAPLFGEETQCPNCGSAFVKELIY